MIRRTAVFASLALTLLSSVALASVEPITSLNDLPTHWMGTAGDLFTRGPASLNISRTHMTERHDVLSNGYHATYEVFATMIVGSRTYSVRQIEMTVYGEATNVAELTISTGDELVPTLWVSVLHDDADTWTFREMPQAGNQRRFIMHGQR